MAPVKTAPLAGVRIIEMAGIGPGPFAGMMLADLGADVVTVDRPGGNPWAEGGHDVLFRSRRSIAVDLKRPGGAAVVKELCRSADGFIETYRPGVAERLGIGPEHCLAVNRTLVYGRMTGWGQDGPLAQMPGHDINYIALTGALHASGRKGGPPTPALNLIGDFGGGGMLMAVGMLAGILSARATGTGHVIDAAMIDGASALMAMFHALRNADEFGEERGTHMLDTGAFFYDVYRTRDGEWVSIGAIEEQFWNELCDVFELPVEVRQNQLDSSRWDEFRVVVGERVASHSREELDTLFAGRNTCYAPVLSMREAAEHPHNVARSTLIEVNGVVQGAPAPRFDGRPPTSPCPQRTPGADTRAILLDVGFSDDDVEAMIEDGTVYQG